MLIRYRGKVSVSIFISRNSFQLLLARFNKIFGYSADFSLSLVTVRKRSCGKVMFLHLSVILFIKGGRCTSNRADTPLPPGRTATAADSTHTTGMHFSFCFQLLSVLFRALSSFVLLPCNPEESSLLQHGDGVPECAALRTDSCFVPHTSIGTGPQWLR